MAAAGDSGLLRVGPHRIEPVYPPEVKRLSWERADLTGPALPGDLLRRNARDLADLPAVTDGSVSLTWRHLAGRAAGFAAFLRSVGIGPGDVVTWQLPTWWEAIAVMHGIWLAGAVSNPVVSIYRERELALIVAEVEPRCVVTALEFRSCRHVDVMAEACRIAGVEPDARVVVRGDATGWTSFDGLGFADVEGLESAMTPDSPALVMYTSGAESSPKGVVHTVRTAMAAGRRGVRLRRLAWDDRVYAAGASLAHVGGLERVVLGPLVSGCSSILRERWDAEVAVRDIVDFGITFTTGSTVFVREMSEAARQAGMARLPLAKGFMSGGAAMTRADLQPADDLGMRPVRGYGMTEYCGSLSTAITASPPDVRMETDGVLQSGAELRVVDELGRDLPVGSAGEMLIRGPTLTVGYVSAKQTASAFETDGWFRTGDVGLVDERGCVRMTGRSKDIINRGGEKIASREIEEILMSHPAVREAVVVPAPHDRLGEQPAAFLILHAGAAVSETELVAHLRQTGLAIQKVPKIWRWPEGDLPRTAAGKVRKGELRATLWP